MWIDVAVATSPALLSVGSVVTMARVYAKSFSMSTALCTVFAWSLMQVSMGAALVMYVNAPREHYQWTSVPLMLSLWAAISAAFVWHSFSSVAALCAVNLIVHLIIVGLVLNVTHSAAVFLALMGAIWCGWTGLFALSFAMYSRGKEFIRPIGYHVMGHLRNSNTVIESMRRRMALAKKNGSDTHV